MRTAFSALMFTFATAATADEPCGALAYDFRSSFEAAEAFTVQLPPTSTPLSIAIDARFTGLITDEATIDLDGVYAGPPNVGASSGTKVAQVDGTHWRIENFALALGSNPITVTAVNLDGNTQTANVTIQRVAPGTSAQLVAVDAPDGHAPRSARFRFRVPANRTVVQIRLDADGNGTYEQSTTQASTILENPYADPGWYVASAEFTLDDGDMQTPPEVTTRTAPVLVANLERTRKTLCFVYGEMRSRLVASNITAALRTLNPVLRPGFQTIWTNLGAGLPTVAAELGTIATGTIAPTFAELVVVRPDIAVPTENRGYRVQFDRGNDGVWRIGGM